MKLIIQIPCFNEEETLLADLKKDYSAPMTQLCWSGEIRSKQYAN